MRIQSLRKCRSFSNSFLLGLLLTAALVNAIGFDLLGRFARGIKGAPIEQLRTLNAAITTGSHVQDDSMVTGGEDASSKKNGLIWNIKE